MCETNTNKTEKYESIKVQSLSVLGACKFLKPGAWNWVMTHDHWSLFDGPVFLFLCLCKASEDIKKDLIVKDILLP